MKQILMEAHNLLVIGHILGAILGVGGATRADWLFFSTLKGNCLTKQKFLALKQMSQLIWIGLAIIIVTGLGLIWHNQLENPADPLIYSQKLAAKLIIVGIILINGIVLNVVVTPKLAQHLDQPGLCDYILKHRVLLLTTGSISITSWYSALVVGFLGIPTLTFWQVLGTYLVVLAAAILAANTLGVYYLKNMQQYSKKHQSNEKV